MSGRNDFSDGLPVEVPAEHAWTALAEMDRWLPRLSTVRSVEPDPDGASTASDVLAPGDLYLVRTGEGPVMHCRVVEADPAAGIVGIEARLGPLRSRLLCRIEPAGPRTRILHRRQTYPGVVGRMFTLLFGRHEQAETTAYLRAWADYATESF